MNGTKIVENVMAGIDWKNKAHKYQITMTAQNASYYIDGNLMVSHTSMAWGTASLRPAVMDSTLGDGALSVDWVRSGPFAASGSYTSAVFDGGEGVTWVKVAATNSIAPWFSCCTASGTTNVLNYRTGNTPSPDASWSAFAPVGTGGTVTGSSRYIQYMVLMTSTGGTKAPIVQDVTITYKRP